jgi:hypothetical protein
LAKLREAIALRPGHRTPRPRVRWAPASKLIYLGEAAWARALNGRACFGADKGLRALLGAGAVLRTGALRCAGGGRRGEQEGENHPNSIFCDAIGNCCDLPPLQHPVAGALKSLLPASPLGCVRAGDGGMTGLQGLRKVGNFIALRFWGIAAPFLHGRPCSQHVWTPEVMLDHPAPSAGGGMHAAL